MNIINLLNYLIDYIINLIQGKNNGKRTRNSNCPHHNNCLHHDEKDNIGIIDYRKDIPDIYDNYNI